VRVAVGWNFFIHGYGKLRAGAAAVAPGFADLGFQHPIPVIYTLILLETLGGIAIMFGIFTRFFAAGCAIELAYITFGLYWPNGFSWLKRGYEYTLMWGALCFAIALRGGGPYALDRLMRREL
jgi:putative oxidoreductase